MQHNNCDLNLKQTVYTKVPHYFIILFYPGPLEKMSIQTLCQSNRILQAEEGVADPTTYISSWWTSLAEAIKRLSVCPLVWLSVRLSARLYIYLYNIYIFHTPMLSLCFVAYFAGSVYWTIPLITSLLIMRWLAENFWALLVIVFTSNEYFIT